jgi:amino acid adenylation domain-containing protein
VACYGSLFRFQFPAKGDKSLTSELFYASLIDRGVYILEGRNCFLSVAHTDADIDRIVAVVSQTASEMAAAGFFSQAGHDSSSEYPLSQAQREMWLLDRMGPDMSRAYTEGLVLDLRGELDAEGMRFAVRALVARHESLRAVINSAGTLQRVVEPQSDLLRADFSAMPQDERAERLTAWYDARATEVVGLGAQPPVRLALLRLAADHHQFYVAIHHAMIDGWSFDLLLSEIAAIYRGYVRGVPEPLPEVVQYREHVAWEQRRQSQDGVAEISYWRDQFTDGVPELVLRAGRAASTANRRLGLLRHVISPDASSRLASAFGQLDVTPFAVLLASYGYLLHRVSNQDDLVIAVPFACRDYPGGTRVVGNCSTTLPVRSVIRPRLAVRDYVRSMHDSLIASCARPGFSISALQEQASRADGARSRVFAALINLDNASTAPDFGGLRVSVVPAPKRFAQTDLSFDILRDADGLRLTVEYDADLIDEAVAREYARIFDRLLTQFLADPDALLEEIALGRPEEIADHRNEPVLAVPAGAEGLPDGGTLTEVVERQVRQSGDALALWHEDEQLTYDQLNRRANRLARHLVNLGAGPGSIITLAIPRSIELAIGILASIKAGAAYHTLDIDEPHARTARILANVEPIAVLTMADLAGIGAVSGCAGTVVLDDVNTANLIAGLDDANLTDADRLAPLMSTDIAYVIYTSGSTGQPKGVMVPHSGIVNTLGWWWRGEFAQRPDDRTMWKTPLTADTSVKELFLPLSVGAAVILAKHGGHANAAYLASLIQRTGTTTVEFVPTTLRDFLAEPGAADCASLRQVLCGGEQLTTDLANRCHQILRAELINLYGPTEASVEVMFWRSRPGLPDAAAPIGRAIGGMSLYVLDPRLREVPTGVLGELYIAGASLARGYLGQPDLTSERFVACPFGVPGERMYRTGDLVRRSADGQLHFAGRADAQVKVRGVRVELGEVEAALCALDPVDAAAVVQRDVDGKPQLVGYVVLAPDDQDGDRADLVPVLLGQLRRVLSRSMMPTRIILVPDLPRLSNGKADRRALESLPLGPVMTPAARPPRTPTEGRLRDLWCEYLERGDVGVNEDFFALGGESLIAAKLSNHITEQFQVDVPVAIIFEHSTIQELAAYLDAIDRSTLAHRPALTKRSRSWDIP